MQIDRSLAAQLGREAVSIIEAGSYSAPSGTTVLLHDALVQMRAQTRSFPPDATLPALPTLSTASAAPEVPMRIEVRNQSTLAAARDLVLEGLEPVALNFASAKNPGGGFLSGARAQEESLARSSGLYAAIHGQPMYDFHRQQRDPLYTSWTIYSPSVPIFRDDAGALLEVPWPCAFLTCAAVNANEARRHGRGQGNEIRDAMAARIDRVLAIAALQGHRSLVLGAWGCGAFRNDPNLIAALFRDALFRTHRQRFDRVVFAVVDWSPEKRFIGPFERAFPTGV